MAFIDDISGALTPQTNTKFDQATFDQSSYAQAIAEAQARASQTYGQQQQLGDALRAQAAGQGPNPAQAQYQQNVNQAAQQAAGMARSQRGISPALAARMAALGLGSAQQNAAGGAATLQAEQQLGAQSQLAGLYGQQAGAAGQQLATASGAQSAQAGHQISSQQYAQGLTAHAQEVNAAAEQKTLGGITSGLSSAAMMLAAAYGAVVPGRAAVDGDSERNDTVPAMLSPGEVVIPRSAADDPEKAKAFVEAIKRSKPQGAEPLDMGQVLRHLDGLHARLRALEARR